MNSKSQPLVSIVTPMYNEEEHLAECIESVLAQTYQNWDYTIVDNCSKDGSVAIARRYAAKDARIRVYENRQFVRAVPNYNGALRLISPASKYCKIVFGDDWIFPECLERMVAVGEDHPSVGIVGAYGLQSGTVMWAGLPYPSELVSGRDICRKLFLDGLYVFGSATALLYRADLVRSHDPFYNESNLHSDMETCLTLLKNCDFGFVHQVLTFSREERAGCLRRVSEDLHTYTAGHFRNLAVHGPDFLSVEEYQFCIKQSLEAYYAVLAGGIVRGSSKKFWDYHKQKMADAGFAFSRVKLARAVLAKVGNALLNPKATAEKAWQIAEEVSERRRSSIRTKAEMLNEQKPA